MKLRLLFGCLVLAACVEEGPTTGTSETCGASDLQMLVGQNRKVLETLKFAGPIRIIEPGMAVTMDYRPDRLNIELDEAGTILRVTCS